MTPRKATSSYVFKYFNRLFRDNTFIRESANSQRWKARLNSMKVTPKNSHIKSPLSFLLESRSAIWLFGKEFKITSSVPASWGTGLGTGIKSWTIRKSGVPLFQATQKREFASKTISITCWEKRKVKKTSM